MNLKLIFGIVIPILIIITLILFSFSGPGLVVDVENVDSVDYNKLTTDYGVVLLRTIVVSNDFFMPRRYETPSMIACLNDKNGEKQLLSLPVAYDRVTSVNNNGLPVYETLIANDVYYSGNNRRAAVEIPANGVKEIRVQAAVGSIAANNKDRFIGYDEILLINLRDNQLGDYYSHSRCQNLNKEILDGAVHINIVNTN